MLDLLKNNFFEESKEELKNEGKKESKIRKNYIKVIEKELTILYLKDQKTFIGVWNGKTYGNKIYLSGYPWFTNEIESMNKVNGYVVKINRNEFFFENKFLLNEFLEKKGLNEFCIR